MDRARQWLGDRADVRPSRELLREGWFGPGTPHPRIDERVGDVTLVMRGRYAVKDWTPGEPRHLHIGNHGGTSEDEMMIPLIVETTRKRRSTASAPTTRSTAGKAHPGSP